MRKVLLLAIVVTCLQTHAQNYTLSLDGINDYVTIGSPLLNNNSFTKEAWVKATSITGNRHIISSLADAFYISAGTLYAGIDYQYTLVSSSNFPPDVWKHVAVTFDDASNTMKLYIDGVVVSTNTNVTGVYTTAQINIGKLPGSENYFAGNIEEVKIWNVVRTQAQIKSSMFNVDPTSTGLVAYYKCNNSSGTTLTNSVDNGIDGTLIYGIIWESNSPIQSATNALNFDGTNDYAVIGHSSDLDLTSLTIEAWVYLNSEQVTIGNVIIKGDYGYGMGITPDGTIEWWTSSLGFEGPNSNSGAVPIATWTHIGITVGGGQTKFYVNGILNATANEAIINNNTNDLVFGRQGTACGCNFFNGKLDEVRIWNIVRSAPEIANNYAKEIDPATSGLVAYYTFNQGIANGTNTGFTTIIDKAGTNNGTLTNFALTSTTSNYIPQNNSLVILPLQWLSFSAKKQNSNVLLAWSTAQEQNSKDFVIQHSTNGNNWSNIGNIAASDNSNTIKYYSHMHKTPAICNNYYRILQRDFGGKSSYSEVRTVKFTNDNSIFRILRNPIVNGQLQIQVNTASTITLYSPDGKLLWSKQFAAGKQTVEMSGYAKGLYLLKAGELSEKIVVE